MSIEKSRRTAEFRRGFERLPKEIQEQAKEAYREWRPNPHHPSLHFRQVHTREQLYSVGISIGWRAMAWQADDGTWVWFWIGSHGESDRLLSRL